MINRMPCRITDDPYYDYSDWEEGKRVYKQPREIDPDDAYDRHIQEKLDNDREQSS
tara:strand:- start:69 stop:236 length:168 start_codon:yes stop_codon:yes gene_type:complete